MQKRYISPIGWVVQADSLHDIGLAARMQTGTTKTVVRSKIRRNEVEFQEIR